MKLTLEISDEQLIALDDALRITPDDYKRLQQSPSKGPEDYAARIIMTRRILDLNGSPVIKGMMTREDQEKLFRVCGDV